MNADDYRAGYEAGFRAKAVQVAAPEEVQRLRARIAELDAASRRSVNIWAARVNRLEDQLHEAGLVPFTDEPLASRRA